MLIRSLSACEEFIAGDNTILRELFHPKNRIFRSDIVLHMP